MKELVPLNRQNIPRIYVILSLQLSNGVPYTELLRMKPTVVILWGNVPSLRE